MREGEHRRADRGALDAVGVVVVPRAADRLVDVAVRGRVELLAHRHPGRLAQGDVVLLAARRLHVVHVAVDVVVARHERRRVVVPRRAEHTVRVDDRREVARVRHGRGESEATRRDRVKVVVRAGRAEPRLGEHRRVAPVVRAVEGRFHGEVPVRHREAWVDTLDALLELEGERDVARHEARALVPVVAVGGAAIVEVHAVEVVLRLVLRAPDALPRLRRNNRHDRDGLEEALAVEVGHRANLSPHVLDHDLDGHTRRHFAVLLLCKQHVIPPHRCERHVNRLAVALCVALHCPFVPRLRVRILRLHRRRDVRLRNI
mmetsp:Transcript_9321/g.22047  ORF Transcript_9321/g.22047 Transcript_9321/m.22047 type:complete len:317 (-) Transcript_9321:119-1069(-)